MTETKLHYTLLPEWAEQDGVMLTWPHQETDWIDILDEVEPVFVEIVKEISRHEQVLIVCKDDEHQQHISKLIASDQVLKQCLFSYAPSNDTWARDHGPISVNTTQGMQLLDFEFNGWGNKFAAALDNQINRQISAQHRFNAELTTIPFILEGGSIETDGNGTLLTTENCLLSDQRNPQFSQQDWNQQLQAYFGTDNILWLQHGHLAGDDTDSHIDTLARFCNPDTIVYCSCSEDDEHYSELKAMESELQSFRNIQGKPYQLVDLPLPAAIYDEGRRLPATYANFLIINNAVLIPVYNDPQDKIVVKKLASIFTDREVIGINCLPIIKQNGSLHCLTMQLAKGVLNP